MLSNRELECLGLWLLGISTNIGAKALNISPRTVQTYRQRALDKIGTCNKKEALQFLQQESDLINLLYRLTEIILNNITKV